MFSFERVANVLAAHVGKARTKADRSPSMRRVSVLLLCLLGCARGVGEEKLDASSSAVGVADAGTADAAEPTSQDAGAMSDAALIDQGETEPDAAAKDAGLDEGVQCAANNLCVTPGMGGTVRGDTGSDTLELTGSTSTFILISISEDDHTPLIPKRLRMGANLNSPGADFDLFLHADGCASVLDSSEGGFTEGVDLTWDDAQGEESGRKLILEVRHKTGACDPARPWMLTIRGN